MLCLGKNEENHNDLLSETMDAHAIYELIAPAHWLTDATLDCYRLLLLREEMKRALTLNRKEWRRSWVHSSLFMSLLYNNDEYDGNIAINYDLVNTIEHRFLGN